jgi:hypothetical protein
MKPVSIRFFTPQDNTQTSSPKNKKANVAKQVKLEGYISPAGKLVLPAKTIHQLELEADSVRFKVGTDSGKRKIKVLYLVPTQDTQADSFELVKAAKSYTIALGVILQKGGIDYKTTKYEFTLSPFTDEEGISGYSLSLANPGPKPTYTGKPRGRKSKVTNSGG